MNDGLALRDVGKRFGGLAAVSDVSFAVPPGAITGLIGPNGAGKTTLVNLVTGILALTSGSVAFEGIELAPLQAPQIARHGIARTFQTIRLLKHASVLDNVVAGFHRHERASFAASLLGLPAARRERDAFRAQAMTLLDRFRMRDFADRPAGELAYGHQRRVEIMRALALDPRLLLLDEPVAGMNDVEADELGAIFRMLSEGGMAVLLIEHNMRFVMALCQHLHVLDSGRLIASGPPREVAADRRVVEAYLGAD